MSFDEAGFTPNFNYEPPAPPKPTPIAAPAVQPPKPAAAPTPTPASAAGSGSGNGGPQSQQPFQPNVPPIRTSTPPAHDVSASRLEEALFTDNGIDRLLNRLKQSCSSAKDYSAFLRERTLLEDKYAQGYKKLARTTMDLIRRPEGRQGTYSRRFEESLRLYDRLAENGLRFSNTLHNMADELKDMADNADRGRKHWKHQSIDAEKKVTDAESAMRKAQDRLAQVSDQYERAKTGERTGGKFGLKQKSAAQQEEALRDKADQLEQDYNAKAEAAEQARYELEVSVRPQIVQALSDIIAECDAGLAMQMAKTAALTERNAVSNGMTITPLKDPNNPNAAEPRGLRQIAMDIDNRRDFHEYVLGHDDTPAQYSPRSRRNTDMSRFEPTDTSAQLSGITNSGSMMAPQLPQIGGPDGFNSSFDTPRPELNQRDSYVGAGAVPPAAPASAPVQAPAASPNPAAPPPAGRGQAPPVAAAVASVLPAGRGQPPPANGAAPPPVAGRGAPPPNGAAPPPNGRGGPPPAGRGAPPAGRGAPPPSGRGAPPPGVAAGRGAPPPAGRGAPPAGRGRGVPPPGAGRGAPPQSAAPPPGKPVLQPLRPVFGIHLDELFRRDGAAVPAIVFQCIKAVDLFGLNTEGIYRTSGAAANVAQLKMEFDHDPLSMNLSNPGTFNNDITAVATLLKNFLRDLPDPLFTRAAYQGFVQAARIEDDVNRRDSLHQYINSLPDPNYATLRVLTMHLHRVSMNSATNKMTLNNLATCFGPTLFGGDVNDTGAHNRILETLLQNTYEIFDPDED